MDIFEKKPGLITGLGNVEAGRANEKLPVAEVKNEVVWVNNEIETPLKLEEEKPSKIGAFLILDPAEQKPTFYVKVMDNHFRSALLGKVIFKDKEGNLYRDVDVKGMGPINQQNLMAESVEAGSARKFARGKTPWGFMDWGFAETDRDMSEFFIKQGLRTHRVLAIIRLDEIIVENGEKISVSKARKLGYIKSTTEPVIEVRAFGAKARIADANNDFLFEDAKAMVAQELHENPQDFSEEKYFEWFAKTLGKQVTIIHNAGFIHGYLTSHNISLDCRVVDLDSVKEIKKNKKNITTFDLAKDLHTLSNTLRVLCRNRNYNQYEKLLNDFFDTYSSNSHLMGKMVPENLNYVKDLFMREYL